MWNCVRRYALPKLLCCKLELWTVWWRRYWELKIHFNMNHFDSNPNIKLCTFIQCISLWMTNNWTIAITSCQTLPMLKSFFSWNLNKQKKTNLIIFQSKAVIIQNNAAQFECRWITVNWKIGDFDCSSSAQQSKIQERKSD